MKAILREVAAYYAEKVRQHGTTPRGVDWKDEESQLLRFSRLMAGIGLKSGFALNDLGCGYGRLFDYMAACGYRDFAYRGYDVAPDMIERAAAAHAGTAGCSFRAVSEPDEMEAADYTVASGIFNVRLGCPDDEWESLVFDTIDRMNERSSAGFAFNALTSYADREYMRTDLYYADPCRLFDRCKRRCSRDVALLHDYGLFEFTIIVRKGTA